MSRFSSLKKILFAGGILAITQGLVGCDPDNDGDGYPASEDCNDSDSSVYPSAPELCDGKDNDCNDLVDDVADNDGDGQTTCSGDCNDEDGSVFTGAEEVCDAMDNNCDTAIDEGFDADADAVTTCAGDCDDENSTVFPGAEEVCDGSDNNCDFVADEGFDADSDFVTTCAGDCDDENSSVFPGAEEVCDTLDNDCNESVDDVPMDKDYFADTDADGYGDAGNVFDGSFCDLTEGYVTDSTDCDDTNSSVNPDATEVCDDGIDNNCDTQVDEDCTVEVVGPIIITELMANPTVADNLGEWFEMFNMGSTEINLNGWSLKDNNTTIKIAGDLFIAPYDFMVFGNCADTTKNGGVTVDYAYYNCTTSGQQFSLKNGATSTGPEYIILSDLDGVQMDRVEYQDAAVDGSSRNLDPDFFSQTGNDAVVVGTGAWCHTVAGTPGAANTQCN